jgi:hypothetical protein
MQKQQVGGPVCNSSNDASNAHYRLSVKALKQRGQGNLIELPASQATAASCVLAPV